MIEFFWIKKKLKFKIEIKV